jgi:NADH dehydrogenase FAD-containing subunit
MIHSKHLINKSTSLVTQATRGFAGLFKKSKPTPKDLEKYDVIILGCNIGGILSRQFEKVTKNHYKIMVVFDRNTNEQLPLRGIFEQGKAAKTEYVLNAKLSLDAHTAHSDGIGAEKIIPEENAIVLRNGRRIEYDHLVVATGLEEDLSAIKGFEEAFSDLNHPVFTHREHPTWKANDMKHQRWIYNYTNGNAFYCIPPYPYRGEISSFNFFPAAQVWRWYQSNGKLSPINRFTVFNANQTFCQYFDIADQFIKENLKKNAVDIQLGTKLVEINKENFKATFEDVATGERTVRDYHNMYVIPPTKPRKLLTESGLGSNQTGLLEVDRATLRHRKYKNIFGLGEVNDIPTTKGFWNSFYQLHVVRHNLQRSLNGQGLNAQFDGRTKIPLQVGQANLTFVEHYYDQKPGSLNLLDRNGGIISKVRYSLWVKGKKGFMDFYLGKNYGPPYYRLKPSFKEVPTSIEPTTSGSAQYTPVNQATKQQ